MRLSLRWASPRTPPIRRRSLSPGGPGILDDLDLARALTFEPSAWDDYQWAVDILSGKSLATKVISAVDAPRHVAFMRFVPQLAATAQVFAAYPTSATILTLVISAGGAESALVI